MKELLYLYCVTKDKSLSYDFADLGINARPVYFQGTYAVISGVSPDDFSEDNLKKHLADMGWVEKNIRLHEKVIEEIMKDQAVLPFKFGTVFETEANVEKLLKTNNAEFKAVLTSLNGKEEWGVKIYCDSGKLKENLIQEDEQLLNIDKEINGSLPGKTYLLKKKKEEFLNIAVNKKLNEYGQLSFDRLREKSTEARINKLLPKEVTERINEMILNSAFLINKDKVEDFCNIVEDLRTKYTDQGLFFDCTGPWPPYNFCGLLKEKIHNG